MNLRGFGTSKEDKIERIDYLVRFILRRIRKNLLGCQYMKKFDVSRQTFLNDYNEAKKCIREYHSEATREERIQQAIQGREEIINKAWEKGNPTLALRAEQDLAQLEGLYEHDKRQDVSVSFDFGGLPCAASDDEPVGAAVLEEYERAAGITEEV